MAFHGSLAFAPGGFLGVDAFFVLSGFLIARLLLAEWDRTGTISFRAFWARRARRLLPALLVLVAVVVCYVTLAVPAGTYPNLRANALATLFYVANWHFIATNGNYFVQTGAVSPFTHTWSLAVEEQFYLLAPVALLVGLRSIRRRRRLLGLVVAGAGASAIEMAVLYRHGTDLTRLYYGTDTHAQSILVGVALAIALASPTAAAWQASMAGAEPGRAALRRFAAAGGAVGLAGLALAWWQVTYRDPLLWQGGFLVVDITAALVIAVVVVLPSSAPARLLASGPLRILGRISYGMYLWHFPLFEWIDTPSTGLSGYALFAVRLAVTTAVAATSYQLVELPVRRLVPIVRRAGRAGAPVALAGTLTLVLAIAPAGGVPAPPAPVALPSVLPVGTGHTVLLVGDSTALTLGMGLATDAPAYDVSLVDKGILGCGVAEVSAVVAGDGTVTVPASCNPAAPPAERWPSLWQGWVDRYHPSTVVVLAGRWEVSTVRWQGHQTDILAEPFAAYVRSQLERAVAVASSGGAHVDLLTAPCYQPPPGSGSGSSQASSARRLAAYNALVRQVAASRPGVASAVDLDGIVCPAGRYRQQVGHVQLRAPDGVHFPYFTAADPAAHDPDTAAQVAAFGQWIGPRLWPALLRS